MSEGNIETVRALYQAMNARDEDRARELVDADAEWISDPRVGMGPLIGRDEVIAFFQDQAEMFDELRIDVEELSDAGHKVVAFIKVSGVGRASGARTEISIAHVWTVRDGAVVVGEGFGDRGEALRSAGLSE